VVCLTGWFEKGARHLIYLAKSAGRAYDHARFVQELKKQGCDITIGVEVCNLVDVKKAASCSKWPIGGMIQLSMVLRVSLSIYEHDIVYTTNFYPGPRFVNMTHEGWKATIDRKVIGTWNLHNALKESPLDFFVLFSSLCGLCGNNGQANYAAANTFLDSFGKYRRQHGLPASVLDLSVMYGIGFVSEDPKLSERL
jgi:hypothetical protein